MENTDVSIFEESGNGAIFYLVSFILSVVIFYLIRKVSQEESINNQNDEPISV
ncbi:MAG: hypothetical protein JKX68_07280 [Flavobacteriales bacterium]|nr:hypothetical protein [Flavobacteriales bacterium]